jgi:peptidoglycan glycosyltransferase
LKKISRRAGAVNILSAVMGLGLILFAIVYSVKASAWVSFPANRHIYKGGSLTSGRISDRNGLVLYEAGDGKYSYNEDPAIRKATLHAVGDAAGNISTSALSKFAGKLTGYDVLNGIYSLNGGGNQLRLTLDASVCAAALNALNGRSGTVGVYNYRTGEIICMVSSPAFDPGNPPEINESDSSGVYINRLLSSSFTPGSVFKLVTAAAAIDNISDIFEREFYCEGSLDTGDGTVTCPRAHGTIDFKTALAQSCNCAFASIALELGPDMLAEYANKAGFNSGVTVNGIKTAEGSFDVSEASNTDLAWAGAGQYTDTANPCAFMTYMGAIANGGKPVIPRLISKLTTQAGIPAGLYFKKTGSRIMSEETASLLADMMNFDVVSNYGEGNFPGLYLCAKSGTAEVGGGAAPNAWFAGFIKNEDYPLAFVVMIENGGSGAGVAGPVANIVLQAAVKALAD